MWLHNFPPDEEFLWDALKRINMSLLTFRVLTLESTTIIVPPPQLSDDYHIRQRSYDEILINMPAYPVGYKVARVRRGASGFNARSDCGKIRYATRRPD